MEDPRWLRFITIGLVLAALAVGYFLISGRLSSNQTTRTQASPIPSVLGQNTQVSPNPATAASSSPTPTSAYNMLIDRSRNTQGAIASETQTQKNQTLPKTGFPAGLAAALSISVIISGWGLRRFPK